MLLIIGIVFVSVCEIIGHDATNVMPEKNVAVDKLSIIKVSTKRKPSKNIGREGQHFVYLCHWCDEYKSSSGSVLTHMHNTCSKKPATLTCRECTDQIAFQNFKEIYEHHSEMHSALKRWQCPACWRPIIKENFLSHYASLTHLANAHVFDNFMPPYDFKIGHSGVWFSVLCSKNAILSNPQVDNDNNAPNYKMSIDFLLIKPGEESTIYAIRSYSLNKRFKK